MPRHRSQGNPECFSKSRGQTNSFEVGDYLTGNAAIFYRRDSYRFALNIKNIANTNYIRGVTGNEGGIYPGDPFTVLGSVSMEF